MELGEKQLNTWKSRKQNPKNHQSQKLAHWEIYWNGHNSSDNDQENRKKVQISKC